jgi:hypothetical protein
MKSQASLLLFAFITAAFAADVVKTQVITVSSDPLGFSVDVKEHQFLRIYNFTQDNDSNVVSERGKVVAAAATPTATASATTTPAPTATPASADLTAAKTDNVGGHSIFPNAWTWKIHVANEGGTPASFSSGVTILTDNLPNGNITYDTPVVSNQTNVTNSTSISCAISGNDLSCTASGSTVTIGAAGSFDVSFSATASTAGTYSNPRTGGNCSVDPNGAVPESNESNNVCADTVVSGTPTPTPSPTPPPRAVLTASIVSPASPPEPIKQIVIDGPAHVTVQPVSGATLVFSYIKTTEPTPTPTEFISGTATPTPTP